MKNYEIKTPGYILRYHSKKFLDPPLTEARRSQIFPECRVPKVVDLGSDTM